ncbi:hypothetical protein PLANPX_1476 [Lacipirellula parvula]|uniref:Uncharacterized protein n=1 Tax=Lacipirellula parvula TaxID=2650471 RepID=A0A5K7X589_9BACT|nr:hypothetical protein PLANPX_1476 [Lacipirellula parvula]
MRASVSARVGSAIALTTRKDCLTGTIGTAGRQSLAELPGMKFLGRRELAVLAAERRLANKLFVGGVSDADVGSHH